MVWEKVKLGDVVETNLGKMLDKNKNKGEYKAYLANINVRWGSFDLSNLSQMKFLDTENERYGLKYGDLLVCEGGEPGRCAIWKEQIPDMKFQKALHRIRTNNKVLDNRYLFYWFLLAGKKNALKQYFTGATIMHMPADKLKSIIIDLPPIATQTKIANILSAYDDLIENNQKQIKLLEEAAQRLYKEWFVDFRFPGYENTEFVDGLPKGWKKQKLSEFGEIITGKTPSTLKNEYFGGDIPFVKIPDMHNNVFPIKTEMTLTEEGANSQKNKYIPKNSIIVSCIATVGLVNISYKQCQTNQQINSIILAKQEYLYYLFFVLKGLKELLEGVGSNGATMTNVNKIKFGNIIIISPTEDLLNKFYNICKPVFDKILKLNLQIENLTEARDRLLLKLMSGEIEV